METCRFGTSLRAEADGREIDERRRDMPEVLKRTLSTTLPRQGISFLVIPAPAFCLFLRKPSLGDSKP